MKNFNAKALLIMLLCAVTGKALAYDALVNGIYYNLSGNEATVTFLDEKNNGNAYSGAVVIPAIVTDGGTEYNVTAIGDKAFINCTGLTSVSIPTSVTSIGGSAFTWCNNLTSITIPGNVATIGKYAFSKCENLNTLNLDEGVTTIGAWAFYECQSLTYVKIPSTITTIGEHAFHSCYNITGVEYASIESLCAIKFGWLANPLYYAHHLYIAGTEVTDVVVPSTVTSIGDYTFHGGTNLNTIALPDELTNIGDWAFADCYGLTNNSCVIPNNVTYVGDNAFYNTNFRYVTIGSSVKQIGFDVFSFDQNLLETTPVGKPAIAYWLTTTPPTGFNNLDIAANYVLEDSLIDSKKGPMKNLKGAAVNHNLANIFEVDGLKYVADANGTDCDIIGGDPKESSRLVVPATVNYNGTVMNVRDILKLAFNACTTITVAELNNNNAIGEQAFLNCSELRHIIIAPSVKSLDIKVFTGCKKVMSLTSNTDTPAKCANANSITELDKSICKIVIPVGTTATYKKATGWKGMTAFAEADIDKLFEYEGVIYLPTEAGDSCDVFGATDMFGVIYIEDTAAKDDDFLPTRNITPYAFYGSSSTTMLYLYNNGAIENNAFDGCKGLKEVRLGAGITSIATKAFNACSAINILASESTTPPTILKADAVTNINKNKTCRLIVPEEAIEAYKAATTWKDFVATLPADLDALFTNEETSLILMNEGDKVRVFSTTNTAATSVVIPATIKLDDESELPIASIMPYAFFSNNKLQTITIDIAGKVEHNAFQNSLGTNNVAKVLILGADVEALDKEAFVGCKFDSIYSAALVPPTCGENALKDTDKAKCKLQVAAGALESYKAADTWKDFLLIAQDAEESGEIKGDTDAITKAEADGLKVVEVFDTNGRQLTQPQRGINLLRMSDGSVRKVMVK